MFRPVRLDALPTCLVGAPVLLSICLVPAGAQEKGTPPDQIVITSTRPATDQEVTQRVAAVLDSARYLDASHITISTRDGVVTLEGIVGDYSDIIHAMRMASRIPGVRRVDENLYVPDFDNGP